MCDNYIRRYKRVCNYLDGKMMKKRFYCFSTVFLEILFLPKLSTILYIHRREKYDYLFNNWL